MTDGWKRRAARSSLLVSLLLPFTALSAPKLPPPPPTPKHPVTDTYGSLEVQDPYQWLEAAGAPEVKAWSDAQNKRTRAVLDKLPGREAIRKRVTQLLSWQSPGYYLLEEKGGQLFAMKNQPPRQQPMLVVMPGADQPKAERVLLDPAVLDPSGHTTIDWFVPSPDGKRVAVSLSKGGTESGDVHVYEVASGQPVANEVVPHVQGGTAGGSLAWTGDGKGFFYTRYPRGEERPPADRDFFQQVYFHALGTPTEKDTYALGKDFPRIAMTKLKTSEDGQYISALVANGDGGQFALHLRSPDGRWQQVSRFEDKVVGAEFGLDGALYALSRQEAPRGKVLRLPLQTPALSSAKVVVPEGEASIQELMPTRTRLYLVEQLGGPSQLRAVDLQGKSLGLVPTLPVSTVADPVRVAGGSGDDILFANVSFVQPLAWYRYDAASGKATKTALAQTAPADMSDVEVVRTEATSKDGTKVPLTILKPRGLKLNGNNPTLLTGYGGFNLSVNPNFSKLSRAWLEQGGVMAIANLRGGSEFGEAWHQAGAGTNKQNVFDDFYACAQLLAKQRYTKPQRLAIQGGSNGGLLMGAALTQHPEAYGAVVARVGIYDMLRVERTPNGQFNVTEYGSTKDPAQLEALRAYSPYHHVKEGQRYPPTLFTSGANDPRVDPFHSRKMVARLQEAMGGKGFILLRESGETGHGMGTPLSAKIEEEVDAYSFLFDTLGVKYRPVSGQVPAPPSK
ncbi:S9 family peptidase [Aggregicoccus sp. 17bor-14]|uniref:prolyl oligopeptidase family serine peptidase n=1 Tax=Myxococcaceae TaxID=31 RepID=UPI00129D0035|nr:MULTISPECIES: prolyl oligopeptidase family serine peptidase [Myxococcaceae]MBF5043899.1 S9 family peptidase [Simulacricoccus sp. 17bor-14]MRI89650.1 S9 family peptidase [Aggregicoccus sp. 17bor-14]